MLFIAIFCFENRKLKILRSLISFVFLLKIILYLLLAFMKKIHKIIFHANSLFFIKTFILFFILLDVTISLCIPLPTILKELEKHYGH